MMLAILNGERTEAVPGAVDATCPICRSEVIAKCGDIVVWHWAHQPQSICPMAWEPETWWHRQWKKAAPIERREVIRGHHVADVIAGDGAICELQHSGISADEIMSRENNYKELRWLFDARDKNFTLEEGRGGSFTIHRSHQWPAIAICRRRVMLDLGDRTIISLERTNENGSWGWGYIYPYGTVRRWIAGPAYRRGWEIDAT